MSKYILGISLFLTSIITTNGKLVQSPSYAMSYLEKFGYIDSTEDGNVKLRSLAGEEAISKFQHMVGVNETGVLDRSTVKAMNTPRCGNKDIVTSVPSWLRAKRRFKREDEYDGPFFGDPWPRKVITWRVVRNSNTSELKGHDSRVQLIMYEALSVWADVSGLVFRKAKRGLRPDLKIEFHKLLEDHGFDHRLILAHATSPNTDPGTYIHFNEDVKWSFHKMSSKDGRSLFEVAIHEFGHALGLAHISDRMSIMHPRANDVFNLGSADVEHIRSLYGNPSFLSQYLNSIYKSNINELKLLSNRKL